MNWPVDWPLGSCEGMPRTSGWDENPFGEPLGEQAMPQALGVARSKAEPIPSSPPLFKVLNIILDGITIPSAGKDPP